jgi:transposase InsO family protein
MFMVAPKTAKKWADRYRTEGVAGMTDRSSRPHRSPTKTSPATVRRIVAPRWRQRIGPVQIAGRLGMHPSTVHAVLVRCRINRLSHIDRVTGEPLRRYEHPHPGSLIHVDVTKFGNIPDGGGWRYVGKPQGDQNKAATARRTGRTTKGHPNIGTAFVHTVIDDHSRLAYAEICRDEKAATAIGVLQRAVAWFADHGVTVERVLSDNGSCYRAHAWRDACAELDIGRRYTRSRRPQTNGKAEALVKTLLREWAYRFAYHSSADRARALPGYLRWYNQHRPHSSLGGRPPISRVSQVHGSHS